MKPICLPRLAPIEGVKASELTADRDRILDRCSEWNKKCHKKSLWFGRKGAKRDMSEDHMKILIDADSLAFEITSHCGVKWALQMTSQVRQYMARGETSEGNETTLDLLQAWRESNWVESEVVPKLAALRLAGTTAALMEHLCNDKNLSLPACRKVAGLSLTRFQWNSTAGMYYDYIIENRLEIRKYPLMMQIARDAEKTIKFLRVELGASNMNVPRQTLFRYTESCLVERFAGLLRLPNAAKQAHSAGKMILQTPLRQALSPEEISKCKQGVDIVMEKLPWVTAWTDYFPGPADQSANLIVLTETDIKHAAEKWGFESINRLPEPGVIADSLT